MKVIRPETRTDVLHSFLVLFTSKKKKTEAAIMMAASVFFFFEVNNTKKEWRTSVLVSGLITFIAAVHYYYMRGYNLETGQSPTFFRYVDWILTVPLMCVEFYLITKKAGAKIGLLWKLIVATMSFHKRPILAPAFLVMR